MANYDSELTGAQIEAALEAVNGLIVSSNNGKILTVENGALVAKSAVEIQGGTIDALSVTANGTYTHAANGGYSPVTVNIQPELQTLTATENGTYTPSSGVDGYDEVVVNVSGGGTVTPITITENGTYTAQGGGYSPVTVNVNSYNPTITGLEFTLQNSDSSSSVRCAKVNGEVILGGVLVASGSGELTRIVLQNHTFSQYSKKINLNGAHVGTPYIQYIIYESGTSNVKINPYSSSAWIPLGLIFPGYPLDFNRLSEATISSKASFIDTSDLKVKQLGNFIFLTGTLKFSSTSSQTNGWTELFRLTGNLPDSATQALNAIKYDSGGKVLRDFNFTQEDTDVIAFNTYLYTSSSEQIFIVNDFIELES